MGRSTSSCLKIITCGGGDPAGDEGLDLAPPESQASSDKHRWSFRKRSSKNQVPNNTVISEPISAGYNKESPKPTADNFQSSKVLSVSEKAPIEVPPLSSTIVDSEVVEPSITDRNTTATDNSIQDSIAIVIQAAIRGYIAQRKLLKLKNVVNLQAAVRGHLVRRQAIGTLRCIQAIVKMQALVRAHQARQYARELATKDDEKLQMDTEISVLSGNGVSSIKPKQTYISTEKLLSNRFARQLMESTPKTKHIHIKCDPSESDSAWKWLERWMAVTSSDKGQQQEQNFNQGYEEHGKNTKLAAYGTTNEAPLAVVPMSSDLRLVPNESALPTEGDHTENEAPPAVVSISSDLRLAPNESALLAEGEGNSTPENTPASEFQPAESVHDDSVCSAAKNDQNPSYLENEALVTATENSAYTENEALVTATENSAYTENEALVTATENSAYTEKVADKTSDSLSGQILLQSNVAAQPVLSSISDKSESDGNSSKRPTKRASCEPLENEGKKSVLGIRKTCNPAFVAAQSKFEELSSPSSVGRSINPSYQGALAESKPDTPLTREDSSAKTKDPSSAENSIAHDPRIQIAASECGTEISISSTLDSPDRSEAGGEIVLEIGPLRKVDVEAKNSSLDSKGFQPQRLEVGDGNPTNSIVAADAPQVEKQLEDPTTSDTQTQIENSIDPLVYRSSPEGTPRSHTTVPESHGTPSSQVSVNAKKGKKDGNMPTRKQWSQLVDKRSPSNPNNDSGGRSSIENMPKDSKTAKKRNSFGISKPDHVDHEPRISNSNSLPSYMQATESARAKAHASISPKSSPDVHDKDSYPKKRHSLPIVNGKQDSSPRMQRSASQAQQNPKGNGTRSPNNSAERRWQR